MSAKVRAYLSQHHLALVCLFLILGGGTAYAVDKVGGKEIKRGAVKSKHVRDGSLRAEDLAGGASGAPAGAIGFFNLAACPSGWTEFAAAHGRYFVGLPPGGSLAGTAGSALSNLEDRPVGRHDDAVTDPGHFHATVLQVNSTDGGNAAGGFDTATPGSLRAQIDSRESVTGITVNNAGAVAGTNAPYIQLRTCQRD